MLVIILLAIAISPFIVLAAMINPLLWVAVLLDGVFWFFMLIPSMRANRFDVARDIERIFKGAVMKMLLLLPAVTGITFLVTKNAGSTVFAAIMVAALSLAVTFRLLFVSGGDISMPYGDELMFRK